MSPTLPVPAPRIRRSDRGRCCPTQQPQPPRRLNAPMCKRGNWANQPMFSCQTAADGDSSNNIFVSQQQTPASIRPCQPGPTSGPCALRCISLHGPRWPPTHPVAGGRVAPGSIGPVVGNSGLFAGLVFIDRFQLVQCRRKLGAVSGWWWTGPQLDFRSGIEIPGLLRLRSLAASADGRAFPDSAHTSVSPRPLADSIIPAVRVWLLAALMPSVLARAITLAATWLPRLAPASSRSLRSCRPTATVAVFGQFRVQKWHFTGKHGFQHRIEAPPPPHLRMGTMAKPTQATPPEQSHRLLRGPTA